LQQTDTKYYGIIGKLAKPTKSRSVVPLYSVVAYNKNTKRKFGVAKCRFLRLKYIVFSSYSSLCSCQRFYMLCCRRQRHTTAAHIRLSQQPEILSAKVVHFFCNTAVLGICSQKKDGRLTDSYFYNKSLSILVIPPVRHVVFPHLKACLLAQPAY
jgi:hypothetical protein